MELIYLIGPPAAGKSTVFTELTKDWDYEVWPKPFAHTIWKRNGHAMVELGKRRDKFSGTDTLAMNAITVVETWLKSEQPELVIAEGDRLAVQRFFDYAVSLGYKLTLFYLDTPQDLLDDRRFERSLGGDVQDTSWVRGRETKVIRLAHGNDHVRLEGNASRDAIVRSMIANSDGLSRVFEGVPHA